jgi:hypothetical protein
MTDIVTLQHMVYEFDHSINTTQETIDNLIQSREFLRKQKRQVLRQLFPVKWVGHLYVDTVEAFYLDCMAKYPRENRNRLKYSMKVYKSDGNATTVYLTKQNMEKFTIPEIVKDAYDCVDLPLPTVTPIVR